MPRPGAGRHPQRTVFELDRLGQDVVAKMVTNCWWPSCGEANVPSTWAVATGGHPEIGEGMLHDR